MLARILFILLLSWISCHVTYAADMQTTTVADLKTLIQKPPSEAKATVVNFWATWCTPCLKEIPDFVLLQKELAPQGLRVILISVDAAKDRPAAEKFLQKQNIPFATYYLNENPEKFIQSLSPKWEGALPTTWIFDSKGQKSYEKVGQIQISELKKKLQPLLAPPKAFRYIKPGLKMESPMKFDTQQPNPDIPGVLDIMPDELSQKTKQVQLIDVRRPDEYTGELGHIPSSRLMVLDTLPEKLQEIPKTTPIVFICRSGARSARAAAFAREAGYANVFNMKGGMLLWNEFEFPVER